MSGTAFILLTIGVAALVPGISFSVQRARTNGLAREWEARLPDKVALDLADRIQAILLARTGMPALPRLSLLGWHQVPDLSRASDAASAKMVASPGELGNVGVLAMYEITASDWEDMRVRSALSDAVERHLNGAAGMDYGLTPCRGEDAEPTVYVTVAYALSASRRNMVPPATEENPVVVIGSVLDRETGKEKVHSILYCTERDGSVRVRDGKTKQWRPAKWLRAGPPVAIHPESTPSQSTDPRSSFP